MDVGAAISESLGIGYILVQVNCQHVCLGDRVELFNSVLAVLLCISFDVENGAGDVAIL